MCIYFINDISKYINNQKVSEQYGVSIHLCHRKEGLMPITESEIYKDAEL